MYRRLLVCILLQLHLLSLVQELNPNLVVGEQGHVGCIIQKKAVHMVRDVAMTMWRERRNHNEALSTSEHHVSNRQIMRWRIPKSQKGTEFELAMGVEMVEVASVTCDARGGQTDGVRARGLGAVREAPTRDPACMLLWDVGASHGSSRLPAPPISKMTLCYDVWKDELGDDVNKTFLLNGIKYGFMIIDRVCTLADVERRNYRSCNDLNAMLAEKQIQKEVDLGRYILCPNAPLVVSSLGAIPKNEEAVRMIHDLSRPNGGVNSFSVDSAVRYSTLDDAILFIKPNSFLAKIDLSEAYRHVPIHPYCFEFTGLSWQFSGD